jgi:hypothetical protein
MQTIVANRRCALRPPGGAYLHTAPLEAKLFELYRKTLRC